MAHVLIYGGTFDPIHHGHLITCRSAREALGAHQVLLVPAWRSPHKQGDPPAASAQQRVEMLALAAGGTPDFTVDAREIRRGERGGASYTIDTLEELRRERPADDLTLLIGEDQLPKFHAWHRVADILGLARVAVMARGGTAGDGLALLRAKLGNLADRVTMLATPRVDISASAIRGRLAAGLPISFLVPESVAAYIAEHDLYARRNNG